MTRIVHVQSTVQTTFGVLDDEGNAIPQQPITVQVARFAPEAFVEAHAVIAKARDEAEANMEAEPGPQAPAAANGNRAQRRASARKKPAQATT